MSSDIVLLATLFFSIALVYASVGFGGGSSYLAILALAGFAPDTIRPTALPFLFASIPAAYLGGSLPTTNTSVFFSVLAGALLVGSCLLWIPPKTAETPRKMSFVEQAAIGGSLGILSGFIGIGGGIFLSPLLHLFRWGEAREVSALACVFILVNSVSALAGQASAIPALPWNDVLPLAIAVLAGGQIGSRLGALKLNPLHVRRITAFVIAVAAIRIIIERA
jgi:uncharacterized membrane protein YfcA